MKTLIPTPASASTKTHQKDPQQRLSSAIRKLDQLIIRAHQLGSFTEQLLREEKTGPSHSVSEVVHTRLGSPNSSRKSFEKDEEPSSDEKKWGE